MSDPSEPLSNDRHERFTRLVALEGASYLDAFVATSAEPKARNGAARSSASRIAKRPEVAQRIAYLRQRKADRPRTEVRTDPVAISELRNRVSGALRKAAEIAATNGDTRLADRLRASLTRHAGRAMRTAARTGHVADNTTRPVSQDTLRMALRLKDYATELFT